MKILIFTAIVLCACTTKSGSSSNKDSTDIEFTSIMFDHIDSTGLGNACVIDQVDSISTEYVTTVYEEFSNSKVEKVDLNVEKWSSIIKDQFYCKLSIDSATKLKPNTFDTISKVSDSYRLQRFKCDEVQNYVVFSSPIRIDSKMFVRVRIFSSGPIECRSTYLLNLESSLNKKQRIYYPAILN